MALARRDQPVDLAVSQERAKALLRLVLKLEPGQLQFLRALEAGALDATLLGDPALALRAQANPGLLWRLQRGIAGLEECTITRSCAQVSRRLGVGGRERMSAWRKDSGTGHVCITCGARASASPPIGWPGPRAAGTHTRTGSRTIIGSGPLDGGRSGGPLDGAGHLALPPSGARNAIEGPGPPQVPMPCSSQYALS